MRCTHHRTTAQRHQHERSFSSHEELLNSMKSSIEGLLFFEERYPMLYAMVTKEEGFDYASLEYFLNMRNKIIKNELSKEYDIDMRVLSPHQFGIPQNRKRIYIAGKRHDKGGLADFNFGILPVVPEQCNIETILEKNPNNYTPLKEITKKHLYVWQNFLDNLKITSQKHDILNAKENKDSVGGTIETAVLGLNPGYGDPFFDSIESILAHLLFSVPAIKGVEFGEGFDITKLFGSEAKSVV